MSPHSGGIFRGSFFFIIFQQIETVIKVITGLPADKNFKKNFVCHPSCLALSLDQHFPICFSWATRTIVDRPNLSINRTMQLHSTHHACVIGQYASFACTGVVGQ